MTAKKGTATSANCFSATAAPRLAAAQTNRPRASSAKASTSASRAGASAVPEPGSADEERVRGERGSDRESPVERAREEQRGR